MWIGHALAGVRVQRVQKVHKVQRVVVGGFAAIMIKPLQPPLRARGKQANRACGARKCTPSAAFGGVFPGGADLLFA